MRSFLLALAAAALLSGCTGPRPLNLVKDDAERNYKLERWEDALPYLVEYNDRKPNDPEMRYKLGKTYIALGRAKDAREHMNVAIDVAPTNDKYMDGFAEALVESGEKDQMLVALRKRANDRGTMADYLRVGNFAAKVGHPDEAEAALKAAAQIDQGRSLPPQLALARFYASVNDRPNHITRLRNAYYLAPANPMVLELIEQAGEIPGPTFGVPPIESQNPAGAN